MPMASRRGVYDDNVYAGVIEAVVNDFAAMGIRAKVRPMERARTRPAKRKK